MDLLSNFIFYFLSVNKAEFLVYSSLNSIYAVFLSPFYFERIYLIN